MENNVLLDSYTFDRLELFLTCEPGWDGAEDSKATTHRNVAECLQILQLVQNAKLPMPSLCMGYSGEISIIWQHNQVCTVIEVCGDGNPFALVDYGNRVADDPNMGLDKLPEIIFDGVRAYEASKNEHEIRD